MREKKNGLLPISREDMQKRGFKDLDIILVSGDAYVDHPSFGAAILGRFLESRGLRVGLIAQPDWKSIDDFEKLGKPRLFFGVTAGNLDSMLSHYTADKRPRRDDAYSVNGQAGHRPDRATIVYSNRLRQAFPGVPIVIGGIEASLRRLAHYDYWDDAVRRSLLVDSRADLLVYGMGEFTLLEIAERMQQGAKIQDLTDIRGTVYMSGSLPNGKVMEIPALSAVTEDKQAFAASYKMIYNELNPYCARTIAQRHGDRWVVQNPAPLPLTTEQMDDIYDKPFTRRYHPVYHSQGGIPALKPVQFSVVSHRGCFGGCSFCTLTLHQGKFIQSRSAESVIREVELLTKHPDFNGTISDVGGPSANMYGMAGADDRCRDCRKSSCLHPGTCRNLEPSHRASVALLRRLREIPKVNHVFVASGVRHDLAMADTGGEYIKELCQHHISGQLKIAPEHVAPGVTKLMGKSNREAYLRFMREYRRINDELEKKQYLVPYFMAGHPGCGVREMIDLAEFIRDNLQYYPEQVQNFTPTPMSLSTCMYYTGLNPLTGEKVFVPRTEEQRAMQRALLQYRDPKNHDLVRQALVKCHRQDLIGKSPKALVPSDDKFPSREKKTMEGPKTGLSNKKVYNPTIKNPKRGRGK